MDIPLEDVAAVAQIVSSISGCLIQLCSAMYNNMAATDLQKCAACKCCECCECCTDRMDNDETSPDCGPASDVVVREQPSGKRSNSI